MNNVLEIENLLSNISSAILLEKVMKCVEERMCDSFDLPENFMYHKKIDNYLYIIEYDDGYKYIDYIGSRAYEKYMKDDNAISITRKTKELFPTYELLLHK